MKKIVEYIILMMIIEALMVFSVIKLTIRDVGAQALNEMCSNIPFMVILITLSCVLSAMLASPVLTSAKNNAPISIPHTGSDLFYEKYTNKRCRVHKYEYDDNGKVVDASFAFVDENGDIYTKWYKGVSQYFECGAAIVYDGEKYNIINLNGEYLSNMWFDEIGTEVSDNCVKVYYNNDNTMNFLDLTTGKVLWKEWKEETKQEITLP